MKPLTIVEADERGLLAKEKRGILTFSNGTAGFGWMECNCFDCWFYEHEGAVGEFCAFEAAMMADWVTPELAQMFGWIQNKKYDKPDDHRQGWRPPDTCAFFQKRPERGDDGEYPPRPTDPDPSQLILLADPSEDLALFPKSAPERETVAA